MLFFSEDNVARRVSDDLSGSFDSVGTSYQTESADGVGITERDTNARNQTSENPEPGPAKEKPKAAAQNVRKRAKEPSITASLLEGLSGSGLLREQQSSETVTAPPAVRLGVQSDGTVILPKIPHVYGRVLLCLLAVFLSVCNAKRFLITFVSWEVAYYFINGLPPLPPANMLMVLAAVMGLREDHLYRVKKFIHFGNCVMLDLSLFLTFTMMPHFVKSVISF